MSDTFLIKPTDSAYVFQWKAMKNVWQNTGEIKSYGLERVIRLILLASRFVFPAFHISAYYSRRGSIAKNASIEYYVFFKLTVSLLILYFQLFNTSSIFFIWICYMMAETLLYPATLIFCDDLFPKPQSFKRDLIFVFIDYIMVVIDFASLYLYFDSLFSSAGLISKSSDAAYFSFVSAVTIGYGDISVQNIQGKRLVMVQAIIFLVYGVLFLNFYSSRIHSSKNNVPADEIKPTITKSKE